MAEKTTTNKENQSDDSQVVENTQNQEQTNPDQFLKDFNWHNYEEGIDPVADEKLDEFEKLVAENFVDTLDDQVVEGTVIHMTDRDAIIDINAKSEGVISLNEFRYNPNLKIGDKVEVLIDVREDATGQLILSHRKARVIKAWDRVISANETGSPLGISLFLIKSKTFFPTKIFPDARALLKVSFFEETSTILKEFFLNISLAQSFNSLSLIIFKFVIILLYLKDLK